MNIFDKLKQWLGIGLGKERDDAIRGLARTEDELDKAINDNNSTIPPEERIRRLTQAARGQRPHG